MSTETTTKTPAEMTGQERGVAAIQQCHRIVRAALQAASDGTATAEDTGRMKVALEILAIMRPEMSTESVLMAAVKKLTV